MSVAVRYVLALLHCSCVCQVCVHVCVCVYEGVGDFCTK